MEVALSGLVAVTRVNYDQKYRNPQDPEWQPIPPLTNEEVARRYCGIESDVWWEEDYEGIPDVVDGIAPLHRLVDLVKVIRFGSGAKFTDLLYLAIGDDGPTSYRERFSFIGYDIGYFESNYGNFSAILSDIIYGKYNEMKAFVRLLNANLLFDSLEICKEFLTMRSTMSERGLDFETNTPSIAIGIWRYRGDDKIIVD